MSYNLSDIPKPVDRSEYESCLNRMTEKLLRISGVKSIFQVGGINTPGISDIDYYIVFKDGFICNENPVADISSSDRYLFCHNLFGTSESLALKMEKFTFFGNFKLQGGESVNLTSYTLSESDRTHLEHQIALEYLVKAWISIHLNITQKNIKVRGILLHAKALQTDLRFLNLVNEPLNITLQELMKVRDNFFNSPFQKQKLIELTLLYYKQLENTINKAIDENGFYMDNKVHKIAKSITVQSGDKMSINSNGISIPPLLSNKFSVLRKINNRLNNYQVTIKKSAVRTEANSILQNRHQIFGEALKYNKQHLPSFICGGFPLNIFS